MTVQAQWLNSDEFKKSLELAPRSVLELVITNAGGGLLLVTREGEPYVGNWHLPGGFVMKNETFSQCAKRVGNKELGVSDLEIVKKLDFFDDPNADPRGHIHHLVVACQTNQIKVGGKIKFFNKLPKNLIPYQRLFLQQLGFK